MSEQATWQPPGSVNESYIESDSPSMKVAGPRPIGETARVIRTITRLARTTSLAWS